MPDELDHMRHPDRGVARRQAFLQAAREVFLEQGYESASVNDVVRRAGGSLATLYAQFGNKEGLFLAVAQEQHERLVQAMTPDSVDHLPLDQGLQAIGERFLRAMLSRENLGFYRVLIGEGRKFPQLLQRYLSTGAERVRGVVASYLRQACSQCKDPDVVAAYFLDLLRSRHHYRALADDAYAVSDAELVAHVGSVVKFLMKAVGAR